MKKEQIQKEEKDYNRGNFLSVLLVYGICVFWFSTQMEDEHVIGYNFEQGLAMAGFLSAFVIAYMITKNFKDKGEPF